MTLLQAYNKDAELPAHPRNLISTFVIRYLESIESELETCKVSVFYHSSSLVWFVLFDASCPSQQLWSCWDGQFT